MYNQSQNNPPFSIPNILNGPSINSPYKSDNFIIPPLIKNNNVNYNNFNNTNNNVNNEKNNPDNTNCNNQIKNPTMPTQSFQIPVPSPPFVRFDYSNPKIPILNTQFNSAEDQYSSPHPDSSNKPISIPSKNTSTPIKAKWTKEEDELLKKAISKYGTNNWSLISNEIQGRTGKQCRERWLNQLNPTLNKEHWMPHEDSILTHYQAFYGNSWSKIAHFLPGRSPNSVKNRWSFLMRHNALQRARIWI